MSVDNRMNPDDGDDSLASSFVSSFSLPAATPKQDLRSSNQISPSESGPNPPTAEKQSDEEKYDKSHGATGNQPEGESDSAEGKDLSKLAQDDQNMPVSGDVGTEGQLEEQKVDWKEELDKNLEKWRAESSVAREKAENTRLRIEEEKAQGEQKVKEEKKGLTDQEKQKKEDEEVERKLKEILNEPSGSKNKAKSKKQKEEEKEGRWREVRDAWEIVKEGGEGSSSAATATATASTSTSGSGDQVEGDNGVGVVEVDGRDLVAGDEGGKEGNRGAEVLKDLSETVRATAAAPAQPRNSDGSGASDQPARAGQGQQPVGPLSKGKTGGSIDPTVTSVEAARGVTPAKTEDSKAESPSGLAAGAKEGSSSGKQEEQKEHVEISVPTPSPITGPPFQPPSLTLSLFTSPSRVTLYRIAAVLGINLFLPFVNGVMLGFGEIFARESWLFGRRWWRGEARIGIRDLWRAGGAGLGAGLGADAAAGQGGHWP